MQTGFNQATLTLVADTWQRGFFGRPSRIAVVGAAANSAAVFFSNRNMGNGIPGFTALGSSGIAVVKRQDFGDLMTGEIWVMVSGFGTTVTLTEIFNIR